MPKTNAVEFFSVGGRAYTVKQVAAMARRMWRDLVSDDEIAAVVSDSEWMQFRNGEIPTRAAESIGTEAIARRGRGVAHV